MQEHHYGPNFHLIDDSFLQTLLTELCQAKTTQPQINRLVQLIYNGLIVHTANTLFPKNQTEVKTRMGESLKAETLATETKAVTVNLARAGTFPSHICYEYLHWFLNAENVRQDHIFAARKTDDKEAVTGTNLGSFKIGGSIENSYVLFPDPMGATGGTIETAIEYYQTQVQGPVKSFIALHLIVTPEYLKRIQAIKAPLQVFALRVDRGLSSEHVLKSPLGLYWDQEKGLNDKQYIIPGAGGLGELLNNSFV